MAQEKFGLPKEVHEQIERHHEDQELFEKAGWVPLDSAHPFYTQENLDPQSEGEIRTVAYTANSSVGAPGIDRWFTRGEVEPPRYASEIWDVFKVIDGSWKKVKSFHRDIATGEVSEDISQSGRG